MVLLCGDAFSTALWCVLREPLSVPVCCCNLHAINMQWRCGGTLSPLLCCLALPITSRFLPVSRLTWDSLGAGCVRECFVYVHGIQCVSPLASAGRAPQKFVFHVHFLGRSAVAVFANMLHVLLVRIAFLMSLYRQEGCFAPFVRREVHKRTLSPLGFHVRLCNVLRIDTCLYFRLISFLLQRPAARSC